MLTIEFSTHARHQFEKIREAPIRERVASALEELAESPFAGKPLQGPWAGCRSYRIGDYRVVYQILSKQRVLGVLRIDHRREVYR